MERSFWRALLSVRWSLNRHQPQLLHHPTHGLVIAFAAHADEHKTLLNSWHITKTVETVLGERLHYLLVPLSEFLRCSLDHTNVHQLHMFLQSWTKATWDSHYNDNPPHYELESLPHPWSPELDHLLQQPGLLKRHMVTRYRVSYADILAYLRQYSARLVASTELQTLAVDFTTFFDTIIAKQVTALRVKIAELQAQEKLLAPLADYLPASTEICKEATTVLLELLPTAGADLTRLIMSYLR